jgi:hypothetical protein
MADYALNFTTSAGVLVTTLPVNTLSWERVLRGAGALTGTVIASDPNVLAKNPIGATQVAKTRIFVTRNGQPVWSGWIWGRQRQRQTVGLALTGAETWSHFTHCEVDNTLVFTQVDQLQIAQDLLAYAQGRAMHYVTSVDGVARIGTITVPAPGGDIDVVIGTETSGVLRDLTLESTQAKSIAQAVEDLANLDGGFDYSIDPAALTSTTWQDTFVLSYPRRGRTFGQTFLSWTLPGAIVDYIYPEDGTQVATTSRALGRGAGATMLVASASAQYLIDAGFPRRVRSRTYDIDVQASLNAQAIADSKVDGVPAVVLASFVVDGRRDPQPGAYITGDEGRWRINDENFPSSGYLGQDQSLDTRMRILGYKVDVSDEGRESVTQSTGPVIA